MPRYCYAGDKNDQSGDCFLAEARGLSLIRGLAIYVLRASAALACSSRASVTEGCGKMLIVKPMGVQNQMAKELAARREKMPVYMSRLMHRGASNSKCSRYLQQH